MKLSMVEATYATEQKLKDYYRWRAPNYDTSTGFEASHHADAVRMAAVQPGERILDVACGTGRGTLALARALGDSGRIHALDLSDAMLARARAKLAQEDLNGRVSFQQGDARDLPWPDSSFDLLYNAYMFDLIPLRDFTPILREFRRVLRPGGRMVLLNMSKPDSRRTFFETLYNTGLFITPCRPVLMAPYLEELGFTGIERHYQPSQGLIVSRLWGAEIILARKA